MSRLAPHIAIGFLTSGLLLLFTEFIFLSAIGVGLVVFLAVHFLQELGHKLPLVELVLLMAGLQWIVGPVLDYRSDVQHFKYFMYVDEASYMQVVVPAMLCFTISAFWFKKDYSFDQYIQALKDFLIRYPNFPYYLIGIGLFATQLQYAVPPVLAFAFYLLAQLKYIGVAYLLFKPGSFAKWLIFAAMMLLTLLSSLQAAMFHDFFLWSILLFSFVAYNLKMSMPARLLSVLAGIMLAFLVQSIKGEFREKVWADASIDYVALFTSLLSERLINLEGQTTSEEELDEVNVRLNQGWIVSRIIYHVPKREPFAEGETIEEALYASLLPRFLNPNKAVAGGKENFKRFTGLALGKNTSMGISLVGESYANFGLWGGAVFMGIWGAFLALILKKVIQLSKKYPTLILWLPILFLQVVKAETELVVVLNHLVKASIFVFGIFWLSRNVFKVQL